MAPLSGKIIALMLWFFGVPLFCLGSGVGEKGATSASISITWPVPSCVYVPVAC